VCKKMGKVAGKRVTFHASARLGTIAASLAAAAALLLPTAALAATANIGSAAANQQCNLGGFDAVQASTSGVSYAVPAGGTLITSWSILAGPDTGSAGLEVWRPTAPPTYTLVDSRPVTTLTANSLNTFTLTTAIAVQAGDLLGLRVEGSVSCTEYTANQSDLVGLNLNPVAPAPGAAVVLSPFGQDEQLNVAATVQVTVTPPPPTIPTTADRCKHRGWRGLTDNNGTPFKNQGDCVSFVATDGRNAASAPPADATNAGNAPPTNAGNAPPADATNAGNAPPADATNAGNAPPADATNAGNAPPADATNAGNAPPADATNAANGPPADATNAGDAPPTDATNAANGTPADATNAGSSPPA
jgi:hypothetical protein